MVQESISGRSVRNANRMKDSVARQLESKDNWQRLKEPLKEAEIGKE